MYSPIARRLANKQKAKKVQKATDAGLMDAINISEAPEPSDEEFKKMVQQKGLEQDAIWAADRGKKALEFSQKYGVDPDDIISSEASAVDSSNQVITNQKLSPKERVRALMKQRKIVEGELGPDPAMLGGIGALLTGGLALIGGPGPESDALLAAGQAGMKTGQALGDKRRKDLTDIMKSAFGSQSFKPYFRDFIYTDEDGRRRLGQTNARTSERIKSPDDPIVPTKYQVVEDPTDEEKYYIDPYTRERYRFSELPKGLSLRQSRERDKAVQRFESSPVIRGANKTRASVKSLRRLASSKGQLTRGQVRAALAKVADPGGRITDQDIIVFGDEAGIGPRMSSFIKAVFSGAKEEVLTDDFKAAVMDIANAIESGARDVIAMGIDEFPTGAATAYTSEDLIREKLNKKYGKFISPKKPSKKSSTKKTKKGGWAERFKKY